MKTAYLKFDSKITVSHINREIYGHFSEHLGRCIYDGLFVGKDSPIPNNNGVRKDVIEALKEIGIPVLRWPGGCFADEYHWKDGIGENRKPVLNTNWGGVVEDNSFGTHEFFDLCEELGCEPYLAGNLGSGTIRELAEWIEYISHDGGAPAAEERRKNGREKPWRLKYLGIGNENWGGGGNMRPEAYADEYRRYQTFAKNFSTWDMMKIACGPNADDYSWTESIMQNLKPWHTGAIALHYYTIPTGEWEKKGKALEFSDDEYYMTVERALHMDELIEKHGAIMDKYDPERKIKLIVDEWGSWYDVEEGTDPGFLFQQNTMRDAITAAINLNIFNQHSDRVIMANIAQVMNVLQSVLLSKGEKLVKTATWQVFRLFLPHHDAELMRTSMAGPTIDKCGKSFPMLTYSLSRKNLSFNDENFYLTVSNASLDESCELLLDPEQGSNIGISIDSASGRIITADIRAYNDFDGNTPVSIEEFSDFKIQGDKLLIKLPPRSVVGINFRVNPYTRALEDRIKGSLLAGAAGDALGYAVEFKSLEQIKSIFGEKGIQNYVLTDGKALISDDTQMTLFTCEGIALGWSRAHYKGIGWNSTSHHIYNAYRLWLKTQGYEAESLWENNSSLFKDERIHRLRAPGNTCLSALDSGKMGTLEYPLNQSKGCGGVMRTAPLGFMNTPSWDSCKAGAEAAVITHGHPLGFIPAGMLSDIIHRLLYTEYTSLRSVIEDSLKYTREMFCRYRYTEGFRSLIERAIALSESDMDTVSAIGSLGEGWVGDEALAIAVYCCLKYNDNIAECLRAAVNHSGDSDSTGSIAGNIIGAHLGMKSIPESFLKDLELRDVIEDKADQILHAFRMDMY